MEIAVYNINTSIVLYYYYDIACQQIFKCDNINILNRETRRGGLEMNNFDRVPSAARVDGFPRRESIFPFSTFINTNIITTVPYYYIDFRPYEIINIHPICIKELIILFVIQLFFRIISRKRELFFSSIIAAKMPWVKSAKFTYIVWF